MIDMGKYKGETQIWYTGNKSMLELIEEGQIVAIPDPVNGIIFKRTERCTELERQSAFSVAELRIMLAQQQAK